MFANQIFAQNTDFTQFHTNRVYTNIAFAGMQQCPQLYTSYRTKHTELEGGYVSAFASVDGYISMLEGDVAIKILHDIQQNILHSTGTIMSYAKEYKLRKHLFLKAALGAGFTNNSLFNSQLVFSDMLHPLYGIVKESDENKIANSQMFFDSELGCLVYNMNFYAGLSIKHLNHFFSYARNKNIPYVPVFSAHAGTEFSNSKGFERKGAIWFYPHLNVTVSRLSSYIQSNMIVMLSQLQTGIGYRQNFPISNETFVIFVGFVEKKYKFAYNCDVEIKSKIGGSFKTHEISFTYQFDCIGKRKKQSAVKAPGY